MYSTGMSERIITINPNICNGRSVVCGTRIAVQTVLQFLAAGDSVEEILEEYPNLGHKDIQDCIEFASRLMGNRFSVRETLGQVLH